MKSIKSVKWLKKLFTLDGSEPHPDYKGWKNFLKTCEVRDQVRGAIFFGLTNCNYIVFPNGMIVENFGYHGRAMMKKIREKGVVAVKKEIITLRKEFEKFLELENIKRF